MKGTFAKTTSAVTAILSVLTMIICAVSVPLKIDSTALYKKTLSEIELYENTQETAIPQTAIYYLISDHFANENGKEKKAIIIGYDGARAECINSVSEDGAVNYMKNSGAHAYIGYCGGVNYPAINTQKTSTAPGWCSIITGKWGSVTGVTDNSMPKSNDNLTLLTTLVESGVVSETQFNTSWSGHFSGDDSTYINEKKYCEDNGLSVGFNKYDEDEDVVAATIANVKKENCSDFIFSILEATDHAGHSTGFSSFNKLYTDGFELEDKYAKEIIDAIEDRPTYENEDWLIIITSDHGGRFTMHGFASIQERMTVIITNKDFTDEQISAGVGSSSLGDIC